MTTQLPLYGVRVFELGSNIAGPYATWILAELGAEVIKIERPEGDDARWWGPPFWNGSSAIFNAVNRNKTAIAVDLKDAAAVAALKRRIVAEADVVVQNLRPGAIGKLGLSADLLIAENPRLVYCNLHAYGTKGPLKDRPGYDSLAQAFGGLISVTGEEGRPPVRVGVSIIDMGTGLWAAIGALAALYRRQTTGKGAVIDASLFETALGWMAYYAAGYQVDGEVPPRRGTGVRGIVPYMGFRCADGYLMIAGSNDRLFARLAEILGHKEWLEDERFKTNPRRVVHREVLNPLIEAVLETQPRAYWEERLDAAGVPNAPIQTIDEVLAHPQTAALGILQRLTPDAIGLVGLPLSIDGERPPLRSVAPRLDGKVD